LIIFYYFQLSFSFSASIFIISIALPPHTSLLHFALRDYADLFSAFFSQIFFSRFLSPLLIFAFFAGFRISFAFRIISLFRLADISVSALRRFRYRPCRDTVLPPPPCRVRHAHAAGAPAALYRYKARSTRRAASAVEAMPAGVRRCVFTRFSRFSSLPD
jgi:hypothetical protein